MAFRVAFRVAVCLLSCRVASRVAWRPWVVSFVVSCGGASVARVVWRGVGRRGCRPVCRVVVRGVVRGVCFMWKRGGGACFLFVCDFSPRPREGVPGRFRRWWAFFPLKWGAFFRVFLSFSIWFSTLKNPRGLFFPRGCSLYGCDGGYLSRLTSMVAAMLSAVSSVRSWVRLSRMYAMLVSLLSARRSV